MSNKKIAVVIRSFPKVSETFVVRTAEALNAIVIPLVTNEEDFASYDFDRRQVHPLEVDGSGKPSLTKRIINRLRGIKFRNWNKAERGNFERILQAENVEIVFAMFGTNAINTLPSCRKLGLPLVVYFLGFDASKLLRNGYYRKQIGSVLEYASTRLVLYPGMERKLIEATGFEGDFSVVPVGVPVDKFEYTDLSMEGTFHALAVGRFVEKKSPLATLTAFLRCADQHSDSELTMVGDGPLMSACQDLLRSSPHRHRVHLPGYLSQEDLGGLYQRSHCFMQHSVTASDGNEEGWPVGIAEACASGLPVIATNHAGIPTQVINGETGFIVEEGDIDGMALALATLITDRRLCRDMGRASREHIVKTGNADQEMQKLRSILNVMMG